VWLGNPGADSIPYCASRWRKSYNAFMSREPAWMKQMTRCFGDLVRRRYSFPFGTRFNISVVNLNATMGASLLFPPR
jgi:hypothetical protein